MRFTRTLNNITPIVLFLISLFTELWTCLPSLLQEFSIYTVLPRAVVNRAQTCQNYWVIQSSRIYQSFFVLTSAIIFNSQTCLYDFDMKCDKMIIVVCDYSAVKGFQAETVLPNVLFLLCLCVHACIHVACLLTASQFTHHWNFTSTYIYYFWMCDVYIKLV